MNEHIIGILDTDSTFAHSFVNNLSSRSQFPFQFRIFSDIASLLDILKDGEPIIKLLFISSDYADDSNLLKLPNKLSIFVLCEHRDNRRGDFIHIFKYQTPDSILKEAFTYIDYDPSWYSIESRTSNHLSSIIGVYSPLCNCYKTSFAFAYALMCCHNDSTLFISLDSFNNFPLFNLDLPKADVSNFSDLIFHVRNNPSNVSRVLNSIILQANGLDFILAPSLPDDISGLTSEEFLLILKCLTSFSKYRYIIIDFGHNLTDILSCLSACSSIYMPTLNDDISLAKQSSFINYVKSKNADGILDKIRTISLPITNCGSISSYYDLINKCGLISYIKSFKDRQHDE